MTTSRITVAGALALTFAALGCGGGGGGSNKKSSSTVPPAITPPTSGTGPITSGTPGPITSGITVGPTVALATYVDVNGSGKVDGGDQVVIKFTKEVRLTGTTIGDFVLPVSGDRFGTTATVTSGANPSDVVVTLGQGAVLTIPGAFSSTVTKAGSPSGVDVAAAQKTIKDVTGKLAVQSRAIDLVSTTTPPPPPPANFNVLMATFADVNSSGKVDPGDKITLALSADVTFGTGANEPKPADFVLPVANDSWGVGAYVSSSTKANEIVIFMGVGGSVTLTGTFDKAKVTAGSPSGIGAAATLTAAKISSKIGNKALAPDPVDVAGVLATGSGTYLTYAKFVDSNLNGKLDSGDIITLGFNKDIDMYYGGTPQSTDLLTPVTGDMLEPLADWDYGWGWNEVDITFMGAGSVFTPNGTFDAAKTAAGSASGVGVAATLPKGAIVDLQTLKDVDTGLVVDLDGSLVPPKPPVVVSAFWVDRDLDGKASTNDWIIVEFNEPVRVDSAKVKATDFALSVSADNFGTGAKIQGGPNPAEVTIVLGTNPVLTVKGSFDKAKLGSGSASGIDVAANPTIGAVTNVMNADMIAATTAWDVSEPLGALDVLGSNDTQNDATQTTADWNVGSSAKIVGNRKVDVGAGTTALTLTADTTIDTTTGRIGGVKSAAFKGAGVFEFSTIEIGRVNVTVSGTAPLVLKATGTANVAGTFVMDGAKGGDNTVTYGGSQGLGGKSGPGGFAGGNGAKGGVIDVTPGATGLGPCAGFGGGTDTYGSAGGGAGFATAGKAGYSNTTGKGGLGGAMASAAQLNLVPFAGGSGGGGGGALQRPTPTAPTTIPHTAPGAGGGGGGGAFRLAANGAIKFAGSVSVNGGQGGSGASLSGGPGGGGAGGSVLIQSNGDITLAPSASFSAKGGKGGLPTTIAGGDGSDGVVLLEPNGKLVKIAPPVTGVVRPAPSEGTVSATLQTGAGIDDLNVDQSGVLDTDKGLLNGVALPQFKGNGTFDVKNFTVRSGATLAVVGTSTLMIRASGNVDVAGTIDLNGQNGQASIGLNGGLGGKGRAGGKDGGMGGSLTLTSTQTVATNTPPAAGLGSGAGLAAANGEAAGGGGASFGTYGMNGLSSTTLGKPGTSGAVYGFADLLTLHPGSGGGGGSANMNASKYEGGAGGGAGGGAIAIIAKGNVVVTGTISTNGGDAGTSLRGGDGGAGSGGAIAIRSLGFVSVPGTLSAIGGSGKTVGGAGGNGRIRLEDPIGSFTQGTIYPVATSGTFNTSVAVSKWVRMQAGATPATSPRFMAVINKGSAAGGAAYAVEVEGAKDLTGAPNLDTATGFQADARAVKGEWVRFRVTFKLGTGTGAAASVDRVYAPFK
ncbi:MAG: hypothetical protein ACAI25_11235 [Planctomycetota bacterium]